MAAPQSDVLAERIEGLRGDVARLELLVRESLPPLNARVDANTEWRASMSGALRLLVVIASILGVGGVSWASYLTVTTVRTEQTVRTLRGETGSLKAPPARE